MRVLITNRYTESISSIYNVYLRGIGFNLTSLKTSRVCNPLTVLANGSGSSSINTPSSQRRCRGVHSALQAVVRALCWVRRNLAPRAHGGYNGGGQSTMKSRVDHRIISLNTTTTTLVLHSWLSRIIAVVGLVSELTNRCVHGARPCTVYPHLETVVHSVHCLSAPRNSCSFCAVFIRT